VSVPSIQPLPLVMTPAEVAEVLRCDETTVRRYVHAHKLAGIQIGRELRITADAVMDFLTTQPRTCGQGQQRKAR